MARLRTAAKADGAALQAAHAKLQDMQARPADVPTVKPGSMQANSDRCAEVAVKHGHKGGPCVRTNIIL